MLLVEDSPDLRSTLRDMLRGAGHSVIEAASVDEAARCSRTCPKSPPCCRISCWKGRGTGLDLADVSRGPDCPLVLMTSLPPDDPLARAAETRAPVLRKPFTAGQLDAALNAGTAP